ncbi:MAG: ribonuclease P protein component [Corynebacterium sp.]|nr:ribonuclease P protein component [Corynebacterium sp.]
MLPRQHKLSGTEAFTSTTRNGKKARTSSMLVSAYIPKAEASIVTWGGPRFGFVISKKVGNSVVRHGLARKFRHICRKHVDILPKECSVVIRALPRAAEASSQDLEADFLQALNKLGFAHD